MRQILQQPAEVGLQTTLLWLSNSVNFSASADPSLLLDAACYQLLVKHCGALTVAASPVALTSAHLQALCGLTNLLTLEIEARSPIKQLAADRFLDLPQDLTRLTKLQKLTALSFPALPSTFSRLRHLWELHLAPCEVAPPGLMSHDFSTHTLLTKLHIGTGYERLPLALPSGPRVLLKPHFAHQLSAAKPGGLQKAQGPQDCASIRPAHAVGWGLSHRSAPFDSIDCG